jgi:hypothetical protein
MIIRCVVMVRVSGRAGGSGAWHSVASALVASTSSLPGAPLD